MRKIMEKIFILYWHFYTDIILKLFCIKKKKNSIKKTLLVKNKTLYQKIFSYRNIL